MIPELNLVRPVGNRTVTGVGRIVEDEIEF